MERWPFWSMIDAFGARAAEGRTGSENLFEIFVRFFRFAGCVRSAARGDRVRLRLARPMRTGRLKRILADAAGSAMRRAGSQSANAEQIFSFCQRTHPAALSWSASRRSLRCIKRRPHVSGAESPSDPKFRLSLRWRESAPGSSASAGSIEKRFGSSSHSSRYSKATVLFPRAWFACAIPMGRGVPPRSTWTSMSGTRR